jgi:predicted benzoate:H+ symporter BenE
VERVSDFVLLPNDRDDMQRSIWKSRITPLGVWLLAGIVLALLPPHTRTLGVWSLAATGFLLSFFLISQPNPRYFAPAWPVLIVLLAVPADVLVRLVTGIFRRRETSAAP